MEEKVIRALYNLVDEIKTEKAYLRLIKLKKIIETDPIIISQVQAFNKAKTKYYEAAKYGKYHPDLKITKQELAKTKEALFINEIVKEYKQLEKEVQTSLNTISKKIAQSVSPKVKYPNELGLINKQH